MKNIFTTFSPANFQDIPNAVLFANGDAPLVMRISQEIADKINSFGQVEFSNYCIVATGEGAHIACDQGDGLAPMVNFEGADCSRLVVQLVSGLDEEALAAWVILSVSSAAYL